MGAAYAYLRSTSPSLPPLEYRVIDNERSCRIATQLAGGDPDVHFSSVLPDTLGTVDIVLMASALQFIEDYKRVLTRLAVLQPTCWLITFLPAGNIPTFVSGQLNIPGSVVPAWFFNLGDLVSAMAALDYRLVFRATLDRRFDMTNFPMSHRLERQCDLMFLRCK